MGVESKVPIIGDRCSVEPDERRRCGRYVPHPQEHPRSGSCRVPSWWLRAGEERYGEMVERRRRPGLRPRGLAEIRASWPRGHDPSDCRCVPRRGPAHLRPRAFLRCALESLALGTAGSQKRLGAYGQAAETIHIIGGGAQTGYLTSLRQTPQDAVVTRTDRGDGAGQSSCRPRPGPHRLSGRGSVTWSRHPSI